MNTSRVIGLAGMVATAISCGSVMDVGERARNVSIVLTRADAVAPAPKGPFVSVVDSVRLTITPVSGTSQTIARQVLSTDTLVRLAVTVPEGSVKFDAAVLSRTGMTLFDSSVTANIASDNFTVTIPMAARRPVMLLNPDALVMGPPSPNTTVPVPARATFVVYNRGLSLLAWRVDSTDSAFGQCSGCNVQPNQGTVRAADSTRVVVSSFRPVGSTITIRFASPEGRLIVTANVR